MTTKDQFPDAAPTPSPLPRTAPLARLSLRPSIHDHLRDRLHTVFMIPPSDTTPATIQRALRRIAERADILRRPPRAS